MPTDAEFIDQVITNAIATANEFSGLVATSADRIIQETNAVTSTGYDYYRVDPVITAVEPAVPDVENASITYEAQFDKLVALMSSKLAGFFVDFYPLDSDAFDEATAWLVNSITNGGTGIKPEIEAQIWQRAKDRIIVESIRTEKQITSGYAARGFVLPSGAMLNQVQQARFAASAQISEASREVATKQAEMEVENIRFAVGKAIDSRAQAMNAAADYIRALMSAPDAAAKIAGLDADAKARMISATSDLYRARLTRDQLVINAQSDRMKVGEHFETWMHDHLQNKIDSKVRAAASAADVYGATAQAALASINAIAGSSTSSFA